MLGDIEEWYDLIERYPEAILQKADSVIENHSKQLSNTELTYLYHIQSDCHYYLDDLRKSDEFIKKALDIAPEDFHPGKLIEMYNSHGQNLDFLGNFEEALTSYNSGLNIAKRMHDSISLVDLYHNISLIQFNLSNLEEALIYMDSSQNISIALNDSVGISGLMRVRSSIYKQIGDFERAVKTSREGVKYNSSRDPSLICFHLLDIANTYYMSGDIDSLLKYATLGKQCSDTLRYGFSKSEVHKVFAYYYKEKRDTINALKNIDSLIKSSQKSGNIHEYYFGLIFKYTFVIEDGQIEEAIQVTDKAKELGFERLAMIAYDKIAYQLSSIGQIERAHQYLRKSTALKDRFYKEDNRKQAEVQAIELKLYENKLQAKLAEEKLKLRQSQFSTYGILGTSVFTLLMVWVIFRNKRSKLLILEEKLKQENELLKEIANVESQAFRAQMNPHFIFNALNSIKGLIINKQEREAAIYISKFSKLVRNILDQSRDKTILISDELQTLEMYIKLEQMRFRDRFDYEIDLDKSIDSDSIYIPPVIIQPFVENAIWHGFKNNNRANNLTITVQEKNDELIISIQDNGVGRSLALPKNGRKSHGINITKQRIFNFSNDKDESRLMYNDLKDNYEQSLGTLVQIRLPIKYYNHE